MKHHIALANGSSWPVLGKCVLHIDVPILCRCSMIIKLLSSLLTILFHKHTKHIEVDCHFIRDFLLIFQTIVGTEQSPKVLFVNIFTGLSRYSSYWATDCH
jgi:hypothetical protein